MLGALTSSIPIAQTLTRQHHRDKGVQPKVACATALEVKNTLQGQQMMFDAISDRFLAWNVTLSKPKRDFVLICVDGF